MWAAVSPRKRPSPVRGVVGGVRVGDRNYSGGRDPSKRISITLPALCCQSGADVTSEKPTRARRDGVRSTVLRSTWQTPIRFGGRAKRWLVNRSDGIQVACARTVSSLSAREEPVASGKLRDRLRSGSSSPNRTDTSSIVSDIVLLDLHKGARRCRLLPLLSRRVCLGGARRSYGTEQSIDLLVRTCREVHRVRA